MRVLQGDGLGAVQDDPADDTRTQRVDARRAGGQDEMRPVPTFFGSIRRIGGPTSANFSPVRSTITQLSGSVHFPNTRGVLSGCLSFSSGFDISATPFRSDIWAAHCHSQAQHAAAAINARQKIANAIHIVVTFNFRFGAHDGLKSDIAPCPRCAKLRHRMCRSFQKEKPPEGGSPALSTVQY
jgi:hypothetical protein